MTKKFEASNGVVIDASGKMTMTVCDGMRQVKPGGADVISRTSYLNAREFAALREFFRHERDEELGRWRDPMSPEVVVTEIDHGRVHVYNEATRRYSEFYSAGPDRVHLLTSGDYGLNWPAIRYFAAHPVPMSWHDAKRDDVWKFVTKDDTRHALAWRSTDDWDVMTPHGTAITAVDDPVTALVDGGFPEFAMLESAKKLTEAADA